MRKEKLFQCPHGIESKRKCKICCRKDSKEYYQKHKTEPEFKERKKQSQRKYSQTNKEQIRIRHLGYCRTYREKYRGFHKKYMNKLKMKVFEKLGNKCSNPHCLVPNGCRDIRCLQIDHINGGGNKELKTFGWYQMMKKILSGSKDYQLLCANCNWIKRHENHEVKGN